jgi:hypothetical protein
VARAWEALDLADLGDDQHRDVAPDPTDLRQHLDARVVLCEPVDLLCQRVDLAIEVCEQAQQHPAWLCIGMRTVNPRFLSEPQPFWEVAPRATGSAAGPAWTARARLRTPRPRRPSHLRVPATTVCEASAR